MINRAKLRRKPLDEDCKFAHRTTYEYGIKDDRVFCYVLYVDMSDWAIREECRKCGAYVDNAEPLKAGEQE